MKVEKEEVRKVKITEYYCDECGEEASDSFGNPYICKICYKNFCNKHIVRDDRHWGDYPDKYCQNCWDIGKKYMDKIKEIDLKSEEDMEEQEALWYKEARGHIKE